jgi:signal transduction histidine kinase/CheY-like chemotaxis protein
MNLQSLRVRSLETRMTLSTLAIFLVSMWALAYYATSTLHMDMERMLGRQQFSTVSLIAGQINDGLNNRIQALQAVAGEVTPAMLVKQATLQTLLESRPLLKFLFNGGVFVTGADGTAIADLPISAGRIGLNYMDQVSVSTALKQGKTMFSRPTVGKKLRGPLFSISAPIHGSNGKVLGVLVGVIDLSIPNFLEQLTQSSDAQLGRYLVIARDSRLIVTATDKHRIMQPVLGLVAMVNRYLGGYEGTDVFVNTLGIEVLSSVKGIPSANWYLAASLPTAEAFAPIYNMQQRMLWATLVLSALACCVTWWLLRRQLSPVLGTVEKLAAMANGVVPLAPLPVPQRCEMTALVTGVNRVFKTLELRETALIESDAFRNAIIDSVAAEIVVLDGNGVITAVNQPWQRFSVANGLVNGCFAPHTDIGTDYLVVCRAAIGTADEAHAMRAADGIQAVLDRSLAVFEMEYPCDAPDQKRWFRMIVTPLDRPNGGAVVAHNDITDFKLVEAQLLSAKTSSEMANDAKSHFLAAVSHDLRQPLAALTLYVDMLDCDAPDKLAKLVPRIKDCAGNLGGLLGDLLDLSKLQAGAVVPVLTNFPMSEVLNTLQSVHAAQAMHKGLQLRVRASTLTLRTDHTLMLRLLGNLVANAVHYTHSGGVLVACRRHAKRQWLEVYDTGIGIAEGQIPSIFDEFSQLSGHTGSGLGLYVVAKTAELMGLQVRVRSVVGRGSMFAVELPIAAHTQRTDQPPAPTRVTRLRIALVDDNAVVLHATTLALEDMGHEVVSATTGRGLIAAMHGHAPDLIVTDYHLADEETGDDVIQDARAVFGETLPALLITAETDKARLSQINLEGVVVLFKPVQVNALREAIAQVTG